MMKTLKTVVVPKLIELTKSSKLKWTHCVGAIGFIARLSEWTLIFEVGRNGESNVLEFSHPDYDPEEPEGTDYAHLSWLRWSDVVLIPLMMVILDQLNGSKPESIPEKAESSNLTPAIDDLIKSLKIASSK